MISATYGGDVFEEFLRMASFCFCHLGSPEPSLGNSVSWSDVKADLTFLPTTTPEIRLRKYITSSEKADTALFTNKKVLYDIVSIIASWLFKLNWYLHVVFNKKNFCGNLAKEN